MNIIFGCGAWGHKAIDSFRKLNKPIDYLCDNNESLWGEKIQGIPVISPKELTQKHTDICVYIAVLRSEDAIKSQLEELGITKIKSAFEIIEKIGIKNNIEFSNELLKRVRFNVANYIEYLEEIKKYSRELYDFEKKITKTSISSNDGIGMIGIKGNCSYCQKEVLFKYSYNINDDFSHKFSPFRTNLYCHSCGLSARQRNMYEYLRSNIDNDKKIYMCERKSKLYEILKKYYVNLEGSEYLGEKYASGEIVGGIRHEDITRLSFNNEEFDVYVSLDVFEHLATPNAAFGEAYRVLNKGGELLFTIPFFTELQTSIIRCKMNEIGELDHLLEPEYHGNTISSSKSLAFYNYGWDILDWIKEIGFKDVHINVAYNPTNGLLGIGQQLIFVAKK